MFFHKSTTSLFFGCWWSEQLRSTLASNDAIKFIHGGICCSLSVLFIPLFQFFRRHCVSHQVASHLVKFMFYSSMFQPECSLNSFALIPFLSYSNRSHFIVYLIPWAFDSRHSRRSSLLLECSRLFASSLEFLFHLIHFPFRLGPKISGRNLLLVEECCNAPDSMRLVSTSYSP